jgi:hypothetical protein
MISSQQSKFFAAFRQKSTQFCPMVAKAAPEWHDPIRRLSKRAVKTICQPG